MRGFSGRLTVTKSWIDQFKYVLIDVDAGACLDENMMT